MINEFSTNIKLNGYYGTWQTISKLEHNNKVAFLLTNEYKHYENCRIIVDENRNVLVEDGKNMGDFIKYLNDIEFYYGGSLRRR